MSFKDDLAPGGSIRIDGECPICEAASEFVATSEVAVPARWLPYFFRDSLRCARCGSLPRERALFATVVRLYPDWRKMHIHESSPEHRGASARFLAECENYTVTQYDPALGFGTSNGRYRSEDLEAQTFESGVFDLVVTQDVFEHIFHPDRAIQEIARTLRPGGAHIFTVPLVNGIAASRRRAALVDGDVRHIEPAAYHGNPMSPDGSLVTMDWGYDIASYLSAKSELIISLVDIYDPGRGICAAYNEVIIGLKPHRTLDI